MPSPTYETRVRALRDVAPGVREVTLEPPAEPFSYEAGQWIGLHLPIGDRPPLVRAYSLAAAPSPTGELVLCLDRIPEGLASEYLFTLQPGARLTFAGPLGNFVLPEGGGDLLWIARYTGIVPFRPMLQRLLQSASITATVTLLYSAPRPEDLAYHEEFAPLATPQGWFRYFPVVDEPADGWGGLTGPVLDLLPDLVGERLDLTPMVCGIREFVRPVRDFFYERGYERRAVKWENYD